MVDPNELPVPEGVDKSKALSLIEWIINAESENDKTHRESDPGMIQRIGKKIQGDVKCL